MSRLPEDVRSSVRFFAFYLANGTLARDVLGDLDYRKDLLQFGSDLETPFAIFTNVLEVDDDGRVTNNAQAQRRAAQWIRSYCDPDYVIEPPLADWETELL